jgi:hypothetical protein
MAPTKGSYHPFSLFVCAAVFIRRALLQEDALECQFYASPAKQHGLSRLAIGDDAPIIRGARNL